MQWWLLFALLHGWYGSQPSLELLMSLKCWDNCCNIFHGCSNRLPEHPIHLHSAAAERKQKTRKQEVAEVWEGDLQNQKEVISACHKTSPSLAGEWGNFHVAYILLYPSRTWALPCIRKHLQMQSSSGIAGIHSCVSESASWHLLHTFL